MKFTDDYKVRVFDRLFMSDSLEHVVKAELEIAYELAEPNDLNIKEALRKAIRYYSSNVEYDDFKRRQGIE